MSKLARAIVVSAVAGLTLMSSGALASADNSSLSLSKATPAASRGNCSYASSSYRPLLKQGYTGVAVKQAQCLSNLYGSLTIIDVDGVFGSKTLAKIKWIQGLHGLDQDGIIGPRTWNALYS